MKRDLQGHYITISTVGEKAQAFFPAPLPLAPPIEWSPELREKFDHALLALGRLDSVSALAPAPLLSCFRLQSMFRSVWGNWNYFYTTNRKRRRF